MATTSVSASATGVLRCVVVPSPIMPNVLLPQANTVPLLVNASECAVPAATATTLDRPATGCGTRRVVKVLSPICPLLFAPKAQTLPSGSTISVCSWPAAIVTLVGTCATAGDETAVSRRIT
jgi:hypothetical protein